MTRIAVITILEDQLDWIKKHPERFVDGLVSRILMEETDKYPGYARWNGDGIPGVQLILVTNNDQTSIISVGNGTGIRIGSTSIKNENKKETKLAILKNITNKLLNKFNGNKNV